MVGSRHGRRPNPIPNPDPGPKRSRNATAPLLIFLTTTVDHDLRTEDHDLPPYTDIETKKTRNRTCAVSVALVHGGGGALVKPPLSD